MGALRKVMPITASTFIVGWLAIAGVPPFSGFWSKDEILLNAWHKSPILWAVGLVTALLTAFYMSRQVFMVFFGDARWNDARDQHGDAEVESEHAHGEIHPHESPWTMTVPLVVLSILAILGGGMNLPFTEKTQLLERWLRPVVEAGEVHGHASTALKVALAAIAVVAALIGIAVAYAVYIRNQVAPVEPDVLLHAWHVDEGIAAFVGGPGTAAAAFTADVVDKQGIVGAVNGVGVLVREGSARLRVVQTGYVRTYALGIAGGAVLLLGWFISRAGF
jgi:NADH-quinone oxidoreductase subunit L